ncbi:MAG: hypothetical protein ACI8XM_002061 [Haloarculaceae archaeon]|jgi:hypothetical protein
MAQAHESSRPDVASGDISIGWRVFQLLGLLTALSWLASYILFASPFQWVGPLFAGTLPEWGAVVFDFSPIVSLIVILLAIAPDRLRFADGGTTLAYAARAIIFIVPALWMVNVFIGTPMVNKLIAEPLNASRMIPMFSGVFLHVVFQHWFQAIAAIGFALVPNQFGSLTDSASPAGVQCAVVQCE